METVNNPAGVALPHTRDEHEGKIKSFTSWIGAVEQGTFPGKSSLHIATLLNLLNKELDQALADYERESMSHPEWGSRVPTAPARA